MKALIIDDEPLARDIIREYLTSYPSIEVMQECSDGFEGIKAIQQHQPDLIFLDIQMPKINGFEMLELAEYVPKVIFATAFDEYAVKAFEAHAVDYLLKPFSRQRFDAAVQKLMANGPSREQVPAVMEAAAKSPDQSNRIVVKDGGKIRIIPIAQVQYLEAADDYIKIHTADGSFLKKKTMQFFEETLSAAQFIRIHRSYIVNANLITRIDPYEKEGHLALLTTGARLPVSKAGYARLREALGI